MQDFILIKNWTSFQHYKNRKPPWIKLYRELLDNYEFHCMSDASKALAPCLWLLASEYDEGRIPMNLAMISFRFRMTAVKLENCIQELESNGFVSRASSVLAACKHDARLEREKETEVETYKQEKEKAIAQTQGARELIGFSIFWDAYPRKIGKPLARRAWISKVKDDNRYPEIIVGLEMWKQTEQWQEIQFIPYPATFLNQMRWQDEIPKNGGTKREHRINESIQQSIELGKELGIGVRNIEVGDAARRSLQPKGITIPRGKENLH